MTPRGQRVILESWYLVFLLIRNLKVALKEWVILATYFFQEMSLKKKTVADVGQSYNKISFLLLCASSTLAYCSSDHVLCWLFLPHKWQCSLYQDRLHIHGRSYRTRPSSWPDRNAETVLVARDSSGSILAMWVVQMLSQLPSERKKSSSPRGKRRRGNKRGKQNWVVCSQMLGTGIWNA